MSLRYPPTRALSTARARELSADPARRQLLEQIISATTREEIEAARRAQHAWLVANPDDFGVLEAGEDLAFAEEALAAAEKGEVSVPAPPAADGSEAPVKQEHGRSARGKHRGTRH